MSRELLAALLLAGCMAEPAAAQADPVWFAPHVVDTSVSWAVLRNNPESPPALLGEKADEVTDHDRRLALASVSVDSSSAVRRQRSVPEFRPTTYRVCHYCFWFCNAGGHSRNDHSARNDLEMGRVGHHRIEDDYCESAKRLGRIRREQPFHLHRWNAGRAQRAWSFGPIIYIQK